jgi:outer membrane protein assembly factor BamB
MLLSMLMTSMRWLVATGLIAITALAAEPHPFSLSLQTLERDLTSDDYHAVLATMIPTDLRAEWQRVGTPDNHHLFAKQHGGVEAVLADPVLKRAYERRRDVADRFLTLMREAYAAKKQKPPFDDATLLLKVLDSADRRAEGANRPDISIEPIYPADDAEHNWTSLRGPTQMGLVPASSLPKTWDIVWKTPLPGRGNSAPIIWGDQLFVTAEGPRPEAADASPERFMVSIDRHSGHERWRHAAPPPAEVEKLYWKNTFASSTVVTDGERVIAFFGNSGLVCCDLAGQRLWHRDLGTFPTMHGPGTTPVLYRDLVIVVQDQRQGQGTSLFAAYDKHTGEPRWRHERPQQAGWSSPVLLRIGGRDELIYNGSHIVISYDPATGAELWRARGTTEESIPMIVAGGGLLYSASGRNGPIFAIRPGGTGDITETHVVWRNERGGPLVPTPTYHDQRLYQVNDTGILTCLDATTGDTVWQQRLRGRFSMSPLLIGETLLVVSEEGLATVFRTGDRYEMLHEHDLGETVLATPAVLDGRLYVRTDAHLMCIGEPAR